MNATDELGMAWKEAVMAYFKVLVQLLPEPTEESYETLPGRKSNPWTSRIQNTKHVC
jgi:hypothetical protein